MSSDHTNRLNNRLPFVKSLAGVNRFLSLTVLNWRLAISITLLGGAIGFLYFPTFKWMMQTWVEEREYSHGFLIPLISLYFVWIKREQLASLEIKPSVTAGGVIVLLSSLFLLVGRAGAVVQVEAISLLLILPGLVLFILGRAYLKVLALPLVYLLFMVPLADLVIERIQWPFQILSANLGTGLLQMLSIPVYLNGTYIQLPGITIEVARACSGVNFLISVAAIGIPLVYLTQRSWLRAGSVLASGLIIAILSNSLRVALAGIMAEYYGPEMLHGPSHIFSGWFVAVVGIIGLFIINWITCKFPSRSERILYERLEATGSRQTGGAEQKAFMPQVAIVLIFLAGLGFYIHMFAIPRSVPTKRPLSSFPYAIGDWRGGESAWLKSDQFFTRAEAELNRVYTDSNGGKVYLYMGYWASQNQDKRLISQFDKPLHEKAGEISLGLGNSMPKEVNHSLLRTGKNWYEVVFWYWFPSGDVTSRYHAKLKIITDALLYRHNNAAVVLVAVPLHNRSAGSPEPRELIDFTSQLIPALNDYLP